jgi:hypothetical protein
VNHSPGARRIHTKIVEDKAFKLDTDLDLPIDDAEVYILRPSGFEVVAKL